MTTLRLRLVSDFNVKPLAQFLAKISDPFFLDIEISPFGQVYQTLMGSSGNSSWGGVIWTLPERISPSFGRALGMEDVDHEQCLAEVGAFADCVLQFAQTQQHVFVTSWTLPPDFRGYGMLDWKPNLGLLHLLARMNLRFAQELARAENVYLLDVARWLQAGQHSAASKMWYAAKVPYSSPVFEAAARDLLAALRALVGKSRKLVMVDLDNTLWGGVIGETGWQGIRLGGHDHVGEAYRDFQASLLALSKQGIQLAIVSKNDESVAMEALDLHPEMLLHRDHFAGWRINWHDKAANISSLAEELNLGLSAVVFIDDNPAERDRVRNALPEVLVPEWPLDPTAYVGALRSLRCFETAALTREDRIRTAMYVAERERREVKLGTESVETWLRQLKTHLRVAPVGKANLPRVTQLFNKTNQLNLSTRRLSEQEIIAWASLPHHSLLTFSASDKFGDLGLIGVIGVEIADGRGHLVDFILSCRVMGRKVEEAMLHVAASEVARLGGRTLEARYLPTGRNRPTLDVFRASNLTEEPGHVFVAESLADLTKPEEVSMEPPPSQVRHDPD